ncbi:unnamed protein product [Microthlaspi erraticum]|uniref:RNase H type-1 domain-containing protein n=1 Tax=Microthlaspi erraticum TaxID=1685480 RepID=A0A6D2K9H8_9BRAS|nr:unnamed protein product [Microthlaspi erraticum]
MVFQTDCSDVVKMVSKPEEWPAFSTLLAHLGHTDCSDVVKMVSKPEEWPAFSTLLDEVDRCKRRFTSFNIMHIPRTNNTKADKLARSARDLPTDVYYVNSISPVWIPELL